MRKITLVFVNTTITCFQPHQSSSNSNRKSINMTVFEVNLDSNSIVPYICPYCHDDMTFFIEVKPRGITNKKGFFNKFEERKSYFIGLVSIFGTVIIFTFLDYFFKFYIFYLNEKVSIIILLIFLIGVPLSPLILFIILSTLFFKTPFSKYDVFVSIKNSFQPEYHLLEYKKTLTST